MQGLKTVIIWISLCKICWTSSNYLEVLNIPFNIPTIEIGIRWHSYRYYFSIEHITITQAVTGRLEFQVPATMWRQPLATPNYPTWPQNSSVTGETMANAPTVWIDVNCIVLSSHGAIHVAKSTVETWLFTWLFTWPNGQTRQNQAKPGGATEQANMTGPCLSRCRTPWKPLLRRLGPFFGCAAIWNNLKQFEYV